MKIEFKFNEMMISGKTNYPIESIFLKEDVKYNEAMQKGFDIIKQIKDQNTEDN